MLYYNKPGFRRATRIRRPNPDHENARRTLDNLYADIIRAIGIAVYTHVTLRTPLWQRLLQDLEVLKLLAGCPPELPGVPQDTLLPFRGHNTSGHFFIWLAFYCGTSSHKPTECQVGKVLLPQIQSLRPPPVTNCLFSQPVLRATTYRAVILYQQHYTSINTTQTPSTTVHNLTLYSPINILTAAPEGARLYLFVVKLGKCLLVEITESEIHP